MKHPLKWEFPGGKVELGEEYKSALAREILEELALNIEVLDSFTPVLWDYDHISICLNPFSCKIIGGEIELKEHQDVKWCDLSEIMQLDLAEADREISKELLLLASNPGSTLL